MEPADVDALVGAALPEQTGSERSAEEQSQLATAVDEAVIGDVLADLPEADPSRRLVSASDFSSLYIRHRAGMASHARRFLRDSRDVDEVVQETFLRLFLAISEIETELQAIAFARRTLTNLCIDRYRADRRRPSLVALDSSPVVDLSAGEERPDPVLQAEDAAIVREALARLSPLHRAALVKREIEEKSLPQIAAELGIAEDSVKHLLFRARRALRRLLVGTTVEPGVDLTAAEIAGIANRRAARTMMRGANVLIVFFVLSVVAAVGVRPLLGHSPDLTQPAATEDGSAPAVTLPLPVPHQVGQHPAHHAKGKGSGHPAPVVTAPVVTAPTHPVHHAPVKANPPVHSGASSRAHLRLSGPLKVTGEPRIGAVKSAYGDGGIALASSNFSAPTDQGTFSLDQAVTSSADTGKTVSLSPAFVVGNVVERPTLTGSTATVATDGSGNVVIDATTTVQPDASTNAFPLTSMTAHLVLSPDLSVVLVESVNLSIEQPAAPPTTAPTDPPATSPMDPPTTPTPPAAGHAAANMVEISQMSSDDQSGRRAF